MINSQKVQKITKKWKTEKNVQQFVSYWDSKKQQRCENKSSSIFSELLSDFFCVVLFSYFSDFFFFEEFNIFHNYQKKSFVISVKKISRLFIVMSLIRAMIIFFGCISVLVRCFLSQKRRKNPHNSYSNNNDTKKNDQRNFDRMCVSCEWSIGIERMRQREIPRSPEYR